MEPLYDITDDVKREVLAATDLVALIGATTSLKKAGASWKGLCPFHGEKTPSFHVHPAKGFFYCFGCQAKGDAITFVRETERLEFPEAVAYLARRAGITLSVRRRGTRAERAKDSRAPEALEAAAKLFRERLARHTAAKALVQRRGLTLEEAISFGLGAAPDAWDELKSELSSTFTEDVLLEAGLLQRHPESGRVYDRFRNRLTIEIRDARGEVLGFGARALGDEQPKYLNTPETTRFSKGKLLYGLDRAREAIRKTDTALLVEGYFDRIALERAGRAHAVASMGTALTPAQADLLVRQARTVIVAYDGDPPGLAAARKAFALLVERGARVFHLILPGGHDPDSFLAEHGPEALREAVEGAMPLLESLALALPPQSQPEDRAERLAEAAAILKSASDPIRRHELLSAFSRLVDVPAQVLGAEGKKSPFPRVQAIREAPAERLPEGEEVVLSVLLSEWPRSVPLIDKIPPDIFMHPASREVFLALQAAGRESDTLDFLSLESHLEGDSGRFLARLLFQESSGTRLTEGALGLERLHKPLLQLKIRHLEERGATLQREIQRADGQGDPAGRDGILKEKLALSAEVRRLKQELRRPAQPEESEGSNAPGGRSGKHGGDGW